MPHTTYSYTPHTTIQLLCVHTSYNYTPHTTVVCNPRITGSMESAITQDINTNSPTQAMLGEEGLSAAIGIHFPEFEP